MPLNKKKMNNKNIGGFHRQNEMGENAGFYLKISYYILAQGGVLHSVLKVLQFLSQYSFYTDFNFSRWGETVCNIHVPISAIELCTL